MTINAFLGLAHQVGFGARHSCYLKDDGTLHCWGRNGAGELGIGSTSFKEDVPIEVTDLGDDVVEVMSGYAHTCARKRGGSAYCWGKNKRGQLGDGTTTKRTLPTRVELLAGNVAGLGIGKQHSCAHMTDGSVMCWGDNSQGQLGDGTKAKRTEPVEVTGFDYGVARISSGTWARSTCAVDNAGRVLCWGDNSKGQLGDGTTHDRKVPVMVTTDHYGGPFDQVTDVCVGALHACARKSDGTTWCWGQDSKGQLGDGGFGGKKKRPVQAIISDVAPHGLSCGYKHTCAVKTNGTTHCWGRNHLGELGDGTFHSRAQPVQIGSPMMNIKRITAADRHTCAIGHDGTTWCWGKDFLDVLFPGPVSNVPVELDLF